MADHTDPELLNNVLQLLTDQVHWRVFFQSRACRRTHLRALRCVYIFTDVSKFIRCPLKPFILGIVWIKLLQ
jgi:hypothetical protein